MCDMYTNARFEWFFICRSFFPRSLSCSMTLSISFHHIRCEIRVDSFAVTNRNLVIRFNANDVRTTCRSTDTSHWCLLPARETFVRTKNLFHSLARFFWLNVLRFMVCLYVGMVFFFFHSQNTIFQHRVNRLSTAKKQKTIRCINSAVKVTVTISTVTCLLCGFLWLCQFWFSLKSKT